VGAAKVTERVHPIGTQHEPDVPRLVTKLLQELSVEALPLRAIGWVSQLAIILRAFCRCMPGHQLDILWVTTVNICGATKVTTVNGVPLCSIYTVFKWAKWLFRRTVAARGGWRAWVPEQNFSHEWGFVILLSMRILPVPWIWSVWKILGEVMLKIVNSW
jgi:hypothetical protein